MAGTGAQVLLGLLGQDAEGEEDRGRLEACLGRAGVLPLDLGFARHLSAHLERAGRPYTDALAQLELADLLTAWRCAQGEPDALVELDACIDSVVPALRSRGLASHEIDDVCQAVRVHLLVCTDGAPRILQYGGRGRLGGFVRVVAVRIVLGRRRTEARTSVVDQLQHVVASSHEPELERIKQQSLQEFRAALGESFEGLPDDKKLLLRHQLVDQLSIDQVGALYRIHRSTAARRLAAAREALVRATRIALARRLGLSRFEISSVMRLIGSRLGEATDALPSR